MLAVVTLGLLGLLLAACQRGGQTGDTTGPRTATGAPVSEETRADFEDAFQAYEEAAQGGIEGQECDRVAGRFEKVSDQVESGLPEALFDAGMIWDQCGDRNKARRFFERANESAEQHSKQKVPGFAPALVQLGAYAYLDNDHREAKQYFDKAREADRRSTEAYTNLGVLRGEEAYKLHKSSGLNQAMNAYKEAQTELRRALAVNSDFMTAFAQMALLYLEISEDNQQMLDITELVCQQATTRANQIKADPLTVAPIHNIWGLALIRKGDIVRATEQFDRARQLNPGFFEAHMNYGAVNLSFRGYQAAAQAFQKAIELRPEDYQAHLSLGAALRGLEQYDEARAEFEKAISLDGAAPGAYYNLGVLMQDYLLSGDTDNQVVTLTKAKQEYRRFLDKCSGRRDACVRRRPGEEDRDMAAVAEKRIKACDDTISGIREAAELAAEAERLAAEARANPPPEPPPETPAEGGDTGEGGGAPEGGGGAPEGGGAAPESGGAAPEGEGGAPEGGGGAGGQP
jgi:tetratricopeptide (TPR) repeat protein